MQNGSRRLYLNQVLDFLFIDEYIGVLALFSKMSPLIAGSEYAAITFGVKIGLSENRSTRII
jgi:hypothetical protein